MVRQPRRSTQDWERAKRALRDMLSEAARERSTVTYGDVALRVFSGKVPARSRLIMDLLSEVDDEVNVECGVIIASLVVRSDSGIPGAGYFVFINDRLGVDVSDPEAAWRVEAEKVWAAFGAPDGP